MPTAQDLEFYYKRLAELYRLDCISAVAGWDMHVCMPPKAAKARADQFEFISVLRHQMRTDPTFAAVVDRLYEGMEGLSDSDQVSVRLSKRKLDKERKLPEEFVAELSQVQTMSVNTWEKARPANDFAATKPFLEKLVELTRKKSELLGYEESPYDPLLDSYDPGAKTSQVRKLLTDLGEELRAMLPKITAKFAGQGKMPGTFDVEIQKKLGRKVAEDLGFDFQAGRIDISAHPFMTSLGPADIRITTRYKNTDFLESLYGVMHETGHALYEMGLPEDYGKYPPLGAPLSSSIHESQSRMWENVVGRSREFSVYLAGVLQDFFPDVAAMGPEKLWLYVNHVEPSLIRTEADEVTYALHIVIRMLLEEQLIAGTLAVADLPDAWDDMYEKYLGVRSPELKNGVMQDTHWFGGGFGYFPTYALGNLYNAMMMDAAVQAIPEIPSQIARGEFKPLLGWLRENVHSQGMRYNAPDLIRHITGKDLSAQPFVDYLKRKFEV